MNQSKCLEKIDELTMKGKYKEVYECIYNYFENKKEDEIINIIKYKELLINRESNINKKTKLIEPLKKYLAKGKISINDYLKCCECLNEEYKKINKYREEQFSELFQYDMQVAVINILSKAENYNHEIIRESNILVDDFTYNMLKRENSIKLYQDNVEGLSLLLMDIFDNKSRFKIGKFKSQNLFRSNVERCSKKSFKKKELQQYLMSISHINQLTEQIQEYEFKFLMKDDEGIIFEFQNVGAYNKKAIASKRCSIYDFNHIIEYTYIENKYLEIENKFKDVDWDKLVQYDYKNNNFALKFDLFSDELMNILIEAYKEFNYQMIEMINNFFLRDELNNNITGENFTYGITYNDALNFYYILKVIALSYFKATCAYFTKVNNQPLMPFLGITVDVLLKVVEPLYKGIFGEIITENKLNELIRLYTFSENNIFDLYYKPIIKIEDRLMIIPSVIKNNNFNRTFVEHMNLIRANFKQGIEYELYLKKLFKKNGFLVYDKESPKLNFDMGNDKKGDIDLLMMKGKYIFYSQIKNRANPIESRDYIAFDRKINKKAIKQLNYAKEFLKSNPKYITEFFNIDDLGKYELIPFIITNSFYASGDKRNGVYITDTSSINVYLEKGEITIRAYDGEIIYNRKLKNENVEEGLINHLKQPYFKDEKLYHDLYNPRGYFINDKIYILKVNDKLIENHLNSCYINKIKK